MRALFWGAAGLVAYAYAGYPAWLWLRARHRSRPVLRESYQPFVTVVLVVRNEEAVLERKLENLLALDYPQGWCEYVIASDGSTDATESILREYGKRPEFRVILNSQQRGKAASLNDAVEVSQGEILVFTDARQTIEPRALALLLENFADPGVGCASGELMLGDPSQGESGRGMGLYWRTEKMVRALESESGSVVGATGALYALRRDLWTPLPEETILDDVLVPMQAARQGARVILDPRARAWDLPHQGTEREFSRKVRTLGGNYQLLRLCPWLLSRENPLLFEFVSHKLLRLMVPVALAVTLLAPWFIPGVLYRLAFVLQAAFYALGLLAAAGLNHGPLHRVGDAAWTFVLLNAAAGLAMARCIIGRDTAWGR